MWVRRLKLADGAFTGRLLSVDADEETTEAAFRYGLFVSREQGRWTSGLCGTISPRKLRRAAREMLAPLGLRLRAAVHVPRRRGSALPLRSRCSPRPYPLVSLPAEAALAGAFAGS